MNNEDPAQQDTERRAGLHAYPTSLRSRYFRRFGYVLPSEAGKLLGVNRSTIYRWLRASRVDGLDDGGAMYVLWRSIEKYARPAGKCLPEGLGNEPIDGEDLDVRWIGRKPKPTRRPAASAARAAPVPDEPIPIPRGGIR